MLEEVQNLLASNPNLSKTEKIMLIAERMTQELPITVQIMVKANSTLVTQYLSNMDDETLNCSLEQMIDILLQIRG